MSDVTATVDDNNVLHVRRRPVKAQAVQFTGKNGREVVAFADSIGHVAKNGGSYVKFPNDATQRTARKGDWVVWDATGRLEVLDSTGFERLFSIKG